MENKLVHEIELYPFETFLTLLEHEVSMSRRYKKPLTLIHLAVEADAGPDILHGPDAQYGAENFAINALNIEVRETDIPCRKGNEFLILMPVTDEQGGRIVCERLEKIFHGESQIYDKVSFKMSTDIGMVTLAGDPSLSSQKLMQNAAKALEHARKNRSGKAVVFSDIA